MGKKKGVSGAKLISVSDGNAKMAAEEKERLKRYDRGPANRSKGVVKHRLKLSIKRSEKKISSATKKAAQAEILLPTEAGVLEAEGEMERTARFTQRQVAQAVDVQTQRKAYNMTLDRFGPYRACYSTNGRHLLLGGRKGHIAVLDWEEGRIKQELHVRETVRDVTFFRDHTMFAVAQHKNLYIYDANGVELHCLRDHRPEVNRLGFLRYHWLLATVGSSGHLRYLDVSTGANVSDLSTRLGACDCMRLNPWNAVVHLGHRNGTVTLWTPNMHEPVVKMLCHKGVRRARIPCKPRVGFRRRPARRPRSGVLVHPVPPPDPLCAKLLPIPPIHPLARAVLLTSDRPSTPSPSIGLGGTWPRLAATAPSKCGTSGRTARCTRTTRRGLRPI